MFQLLDVPTKMIISKLASAWNLMPSDQKIVYFEEAKDLKRQKEEETEKLLSTLTAEQVDLVKQTIKETKQSIRKNRQRLKDKRVDN